MNFPANIIVVAGTASNSGKTTLVCALLRELTRTAPWEAIKLSRGHYRSCGKDPHACCVSGLLGEQPTVRSGKAETYASGKDTGRYWDAGASNVHWVIATDEQVAAGMHAALRNVAAPNVVIEGTSVLRHLTPTFAVMAVNEHAVMKSSARWALDQQKIDALYVASNAHPPADLRHLPAFEADDFEQLLALWRTRAAICAV